MLGGLSGWDPLGLSEEEPSSLTQRLRQELKELRAGVRAIVEANQGLQ